MTKSKAIKIVLLLFIISIVLRLPNLNRIISKHHEFNTAMVLINMQSWRQAGGGSKFHFIPLINFQNAGDKRPNKDHYSVDSNGNQMYVSSGPAWFVIPYFVYEIFGLPVVPIYIQIINLIFNLASVILFFRLLELFTFSPEENKYKSIILGCFFFMYTPCTLWYFGNGYINIGIQMPFVIAFFSLIIPMIQSPQKIAPGKLFLLSSLIIVLVYFDWFILGVCAIIGIYLLFNLKKQKEYFLILLIIFLSSVAGLALLFWQFASYAGWHSIMTYWSKRFCTRSFTNTGGSSFFELSKYVIQNFITAYLPILILLIGLCFFALVKKIKIYFSKIEKIFLGIYVSSIVLYNITLFEWSSDHEYSVIPWSILFCYLSTKLIIHVSAKRLIMILVMMIFLATMFQYYFINRPGKISREGTPYISYKNFGDSLKQVPPDYKIFTDLKQDPMIEYYAGRNMVVVPELDSAKNYITKWKIEKAVWIDHDNFNFKKIVYLNK